MKCPHCNKDIREASIVSEASRINGRKSKRKLTRKQAQAMRSRRKDKSDDKK